EPDLLAGGPGPERDLSGDVHRAAGRERTAHAGVREEVRSSQVSLRLGPPAPLLRLLAVECQRRVRTPEGPKPAARAQVEAEAIPGAIAARVLVQREPRRARRAEPQLAGSPHDERGEHGIPGSGAELDVLVRKAQAPERERVRLRASEGNRGAGAGAERPR